MPTYMQFQPLRRWVENLRYKRRTLFLRKTFHNSIFITIFGIPTQALLLDPPLETTIAILYKSILNHQTKLQSLKHVELLQHYHLRQPTGLQEIQERQERP